MTDGARLENVLGDEEYQGDYMWRLAVTLGTPLATAVVDEDSTFEIIGTLSKPSFDPIEVLFTYNLNFY